MRGFPSGPSNTTEAASIRACTLPSFSRRSHNAVARRTRLSFSPRIVSAGKTGRAFRLERTSHTTTSDPRRAITSSSNRPTRTLRPRIVKPRSLNNDATRSSPRRARSLLLDLEGRVADAVASDDARAARFEDLFADEAAGAAAGREAVALGRAASARAVDASLDVTG